MSLPKEALSFVEPISLSSTSLADFRLPPTAFERGFDLLTSRTRRKGDSRASRSRPQARPEGTPCILRTFLLSTFPQRFVQPVENPGAPVHRQTALAHDRLQCRWTRPVASFH